MNNIQQNNQHKALISLAENGNLICANDTLKSIIDNLTDVVSKLNQNQSITNYRFIKEQISNDVSDPIITEHSDTITFLVSKIECYEDILRLQIK